jgi:hypothetical protein
MTEHPECPETPKVTQDRRKFFEELADTAREERPVCIRRWDKQHARDISEAPLHIKLQQFASLQVRKLKAHIDFGSFGPSGTGHHPPKWQFYCI